MFEQHQLAIEALQMLDEPTFEGRMVDQRTIELDFEGDVATRLSEYAVKQLNNQERDAVKSITCGLEEPLCVEREVIDAEKFGKKAEQIVREENPNGVLDDCELVFVSDVQFTPDEMCRITIVVDSDSNGHDN